MAQVYIKRYLPLLRFSLELPYIRIYTAIMNENIESFIIEYVALCWSVWKWSGEFRLYDSMRRQMDRPSL